jgi:hypothetical protein
MITIGNGRKKEKRKRKEFDAASDSNVFNG